MKKLTIIIILIGQGLNVYGNDKRQLSACAAACGNYACFTNDAINILEYQHDCGSTEGCSAVDEMRTVGTTYTFFGVKKSVTCTCAVPVWDKDYTSMYDQQQCSSRFKKDIAMEQGDTVDTVNWDNASTLVLYHTVTCQNEQCY